MHGIVHKRLQAFVEERADVEWETVRDEAGIEPKLYLAVSHYPDEEFAAAMAALAAAEDRAVDDLEREFGAFLAPAVLDTFHVHLKPEWSYLDLLARAPGILSAVEQAHGDSALPALETAREGETATVSYSSTRQRCSMAAGVLEGLGAAMDADAVVTEVACVHDGADRCRFSVELQ